MIVALPGLLSYLFFYEEYQEKITKAPLNNILIKSTADLTLKCYLFSGYFTTSLSNLNTQCGN